eukprot:1141631-Pelagomonas_calceolata.AAC.6
MPYSYFWETHQRRCCVPVVLCTWPRFELDDTGAPYKRWEERDRHSAAVWSTHRHEAKGTTARNHSAVELGKHLKLELSSRKALVNECELKVN